MKNKVSQTFTLSLRVFSTLFGLFFFLVPMRMGGKWTSLHIALFYAFATCYVIIACTRIKRVSTSMWLTFASSCFVALPLFTTVAQLIVSTINGNLGVTDIYMWIGLALTLILELLLPLALVCEFIGASWHAGS